MTGNIIVSTSCLGAPEDEGVFTAISPSQTCANYYSGHFSLGPQACLTSGDSPMNMCMSGARLHVSPQEPLP